MKFKVIWFVCALLGVQGAFAQTSSTTVDTSQTTTTKLPTDTSSQTKRWDLMIRSWAEGQVHGMNRASDRQGLAKEGAEGTETMTDTLEMRTTYKLNDTSALGVGLEATHSFGSVKGNDNGQFTMNDSYVQFAQSKIPLAGPATLKWYVRPYLPTSEASQNAESGRYLMIRASASASMPIGSGFDVSYNLEPRYFFQKNNAFKTYKPDGKFDKWKASENYRLKHWAELQFKNKSKTFQAYQRLGLRNQIYNQQTDANTGVAVKAAQKDQLYSETAVGYQVLDNFLAKVGVYTDSNDFRNNERWQWYDDKAYLYFFEGTVTF